MTAPGRKARRTSDAEVFAAELEATVDPVDEAVNKAQPSVLDDPKASAGQLREALVAETGMAVGEKLSATQVREMLAQAREEARAEALAEMATTPHIPDEVMVAPEKYHVIHFVEDGLTAPDSATSQRVWYRGEEMAVEKGGELWGQVRDWIHLNAAEQYDRWGVHYFDKGPWPYGLYDTSDPDLTDQERKELEKANRRRLARSGQNMPAGSSISKSRPRSSRAPSFLQAGRE